MSAHDMRTPLKRARGVGSAQSGVSHWWKQRITAVAMVLLMIWFVLTLLSLLHSDYPTARAAVAKPWNATLLVALLVTMFWHAVLGLQVVIEDYVHTRWKEVFVLIVIKFLAVLAALASVLAVLRIALGG